MSNLINFVNRDNIATKANKSNKVDALKIIEYYLSLHPSNRVKPNSLLYSLAVKQYNENIQNTLIRPAIPSWFCGKINPTTNELELGLTDEELRASAGVVLDPLIPTLSGAPDTPSGYLIDTCLENGTPGSYNYTLCDSGLDTDEAEALIEDWLTGMESIGGLGVPAWSGLLGIGAGGEAGMGGGGTAGGLNSGGSATVSITFGSANSSKVSWGGGAGTSSWPEKYIGHALVVGTVHLYRKNASGAWIGGKFEWFRKGSTSVGSSNILSGYGGQTIPRSGEQVAIMLVSSDGSKKSNLAVGTWR